MKIRLGYVCIALNLEKVTSSKTITYTRYAQIKNKDDQLKKLKEITASNIESLNKILDYNIKNNIHFYRITSNLIPLATHPDVNWDFEKYFKRDFELTGEKIKKNNLRVDLHPDQFNVINSIKDDVVKNTIRNLDMQSKVLDMMKIENGKMVIHIGSSQGGIEESKQRFIENIKKFPHQISNKLILENDDKTFNSCDVLEICKKAKKPMVLDVHHHKCNSTDKLECILNDIFDTWKNENLNPKIHFSSPRDFENDRKHADFIDVNDFLQFIYMSKKVSNQNFDVMIEAKQKDKALFKLVEEIKRKDKNIKFIDNTTIEI